MEIKEEIAALSIQRGTIIHSTIFENINHGKFFVVIGEQDNNLVGFFFINSWINQYIQRRPEMLELQVALSEDDYNFLTHNSFLDCSTLKTINKSYLAQSIANRTSTIKGILSKEELTVILKKVRNSSLFNEKIKDTFFSL